MKPGELRRKLDELSTRLRDLPMRLSVSRKIGALLAAMLLIAGVNVAVVAYYQSQVANDSNAIDKAGEQEMLTQQMVRYAIAHEQGDPTAEQRLQRAMDRYDDNLDALDDGGTVSGEQVPAVPASARDELTAQREEWNAYRDRIQTVLDAEPGSTDYEGALSYMQSNSENLLTRSESLATAVSTESSRKVAQMQRILVALLLVDIAVFVAGILVSRRYLMDPLATLDEVAERIAAGELEADVVGASSHFQRGSDEIAGIATTVETMRDTVSERIDEAERARADAEAAKADAQKAKQEAETLSATLEATALEFNETMRTAAAGDLTQRLDSDRDHEAMADIAEAFNGMLADLERAIVEIRAFGEEVAAASEQVSDGAAEVEDASRAVADSTDEIAAGTTRQTDRLDRVSAEMSNLSATIEEVASSADEVATLSRTAAERATDGTTLATESMETMAQIETQATETVTEISQLESEIEQINEIVDLIEEIAEQTHILALNASIEAARAGEAGDGFAVVADEVKGLAEETRTATQDVTELVSRVQESTADTVEDVREMKATVNEGVETIDAGLTALDEIAETVGEVNEGIQSINDATSKQADSTQEVVAMVDEVAEISDRTSTRAETVSTAAQQQTATSTEIAGSAAELDDLVVDLGDRLADFEVGETSAKTRTDHPDDTENSSDDQEIDGEQTDPTHVEQAETDRADDAESGASQTVAGLPARRHTVVDEPGRADSGDTATTPDQ